MIKANRRPLAQEVKVTVEELIIHLKDGRTLAMPLAWFPRLAKATQDEREDFVILGDGEGIHWETIDEDLSVKGFLQGVSLGDAVA